MTSPDAAWRVLMDCLRPLPDEPCALDRSSQRYLAQDVLADRDIPAADRAAVDGYAVRTDDAGSLPVTLRIVDEIAAGSSKRPGVTSGECVRILTGANIPPDTDAVVMLEEADQSAPDSVSLRGAVRRGQHILRRGESARQGDVLLDAGTLLGASAQAVCAAVGCGVPRTHALPRIGVITTGTELRASDSAVDGHEIRDSNGPMLTASLKERGFGPADFRRVPDDPDILREALRTSSEHHDVTLVSGGVSVGKYDLVPGILRELGATIHYHGISMKPGKPQLFASMGDRRYVFGLPGNPLSALVGFHEFALPALRRLAGCREDTCRPLLRLPLGTAVTAEARRRQYLLGRLVHLGSGTVVTPLPNSGSSDLVASVEADGSIIIPDGVTHLPAGAIVDFRPWRVP